MKMLEEFGLDHLIMYPFTKEFSRLTATEFIRDIMVNELSVKMMTIGYNHHFGRNREGSIELLMELGHLYDFVVKELPAYRHDEISISSTKIRAAVADGNLKLANEYLGRNFGFRGEVIKGNRLGSKIGYPTANIKPLEEFQLIPKIGVYAVKAKIGGIVYDGMCNIGHRPTVSIDGERRIELNIFNFDQSIYGAKIELYFIDHIRDEQEFADVEALKNQLKKDEEQSRIILGHNSTSVL